MKKISLILILWSVCGIGTTLAADQYTLLEPLPCIEGVSTNCVTGTLQKEIDINNYFLYIYKFAIAASVFLAIVMIIWGGFQYITSEVPFLKSDAKSKITNAVTGLIMVLVSYLILQTIDPRLVNIDANLPPLKSDEKAIESYINYQSRLVDNFQLASTENLNRFNDISNRIKSLEREKVELENQIKNEKIEPDEATRLRAVLESKLVEERAARAVVVAYDAGIGYYSEALTILSESGPTDANLNKFTAQVGPTTRADTPNQVLNNYNRIIEQLRRTNADPKKIQILQKQADFIVNQIRESVEDNKKLEDLGYKFRFTIYAPVPVPVKVASTQYLTDKIAKYKKNIENSAAESVVVGISESQYKNIFQSKIDVIQQALNANK